MNKKIKEIIEALEFMCKTGDVSKIALESLKNGLEALDEALTIPDVVKSLNDKEVKIEIENKNAKDYWNWMGTPID